MKLLITGGSGYVGAMLADQFAGREDVDSILLIDKENFPDFLNTHKNRDKISFIQANLCDGDWQERAKDFGPEIVIHTAWQIREMYGKKDLQWKWNIDGSDNIFDLSFSLPSVKKLVHFSTVSSYGAFSSNKIDHFIKEEDGFRESDYLYAEEKRIAENHLKEKFEEAKNSDKSIPQVFILRPASITGPRGRYMRTKFNLQSALSGRLGKSFLHRIISLMVSFVPVTPKWLRQYVHEDDVADIVEILTFSNTDSEYEIFNLCPPGDPVLGSDMAKAVNKKKFTIYPWMVRVIFFIFWHLTLGRVPTSKGGWKSYSYPIAVDGAKITNRFGYIYKFGPLEAFTKKEGRYMVYIK